MVQTSAEVHNRMTTCAFSPENIWHLQGTLLMIRVNPRFYIPKLCVLCTSTHFCTYTPNALKKKVSQILKILCGAHTNTTQRF